MVSSVSMTAFTLKLIAIITMIIDHLGLFFFPTIPELRLVGRISFPLFAWLIANGAYHTHNIRLYFLRLIICAAVSQVPFILANKHLDPDIWLLNAVFTLSIGLAAIMLIQQTKNKLLWIVVTSCAALLAQVLQMDYGALGVLIVVFSYVFFTKPILLIISQFVLFFGDFLFNAIVNHFVSIEVLGIFSFVFVLLYNGKPGIRARYLFYLFYPLQYVIIYCLQLVL